MVSQVCSPLQGIPLEKLHIITSNPFIPFPPYVENGEGHPAIDFSFYQFESYSTFENFPIQSILPGKVILIENNRHPYGFMVVIETPLSQVAPSFSSKIPQPTPLPGSNYSINDRCPVQGKPVTYDPTSESIYVLYAHLSSLPSVQAGDLVSCGEFIGFAGKTGNAAEDHLHLEIRFGPSNAAFTSIASYHPSATTEERYNYCIWSLSGVFRAIDPALLLYPD
jgi:murein DD-endopeptidase MepM/ murein hydrolase activator NlpD